MPVILLEFMQQLVAWISMIGKVVTGQALGEVWGNWTGQSSRTTGFLLAVPLNFHVPSTPPLGLRSKRSIARVLRAAPQSKCQGGEASSSTVRRSVPCPEQEKLVQPDIGMDPNMVQSHRNGNSNQRLAYMSGWPFLEKIFMFGVYGWVEP